MKILSQAGSERGNYMENFVYFGHHSKKPGLKAKRNERKNADK